MASRPGTTRHGLAVVQPDPEVWLGDDPDLALVNADMRAWSESHPCECEALCECDADQASVRGALP